MVEINWTLIFTVFNFGVLYVLLRLLLFKPVEGLLQKRQQEIDGALTEARQQREAAEALRAEYEAKLAQIYETTRQAVENARSEAALIQADMINRASNEVSELRNRAETELVLWKKRVLADLRDQIADLSMEVAARAITSAKTTRPQREQVLSFLSEMDPGRRVNP